MAANARHTFDSPFNIHLATVLSLYVTQLPADCAHMLHLADLLMTDMAMHCQQVSRAIAEEKAALRKEFDALQKHMLSALQQQDRELQLLRKQCTSEVTMAVQDMTILAERLSTLEGALSAQTEQLARLQPATAAAAGMTADANVVGEEEGLPRDSLVATGHRPTRRSWGRAEAGDTVVAVCMLGTDGLVCEMWLFPFERYVAASVLWQSVDRVFSHDGRMTYVYA